MTDHPAKQTEDAIETLNAALAAEFPSCPRIEITGSTLLEDTPRLLTAFTADLLRYLRWLESMSPTR